MYINEYWKNFRSVDYKWHKFVSGIYVLIFVFGVAFNGMVLYYLIRIKTIKRPGTYFLINLAIADLFKILVNIPMNMFSSFHGKWMFDQIGCDVYVMFGGLFGFVSISTLVFMSIERYIMIKNPLFALKISNASVFACIGISWLYASIWMFPQLFLVEHSFILEGFLTSCSFNYLTRDATHRTLIMTMFVGGFLIPLAFILIFYLLMYRFLRNSDIFLTYQVRNNNNVNQNRGPASLSSDSSHFNAHNNLSPSLTSNAPCKKSPLLAYKNGTRSPQSSSLLDATLSNLKVLSGRTKINSSFMRREIKVAKSIFLIVLMYVVAWLPYALVTLFAQYADFAILHHYITPFSTSLPALFAKFSSIYNPILYTLTNKDCFAYFRSLICKKSLLNKKKISETRYYDSTHSELRHRL